MTTQQLIDDLFREGVPYAESLNSRLQQVLVSMGADATAVAALFRDYFPYSTSFYSRLRTGLELVGVSAADTADLFSDGKSYKASLNERLLYAFANAGPSISFSGSIAEGATTGRSAGTATLANPPADIGTLTWSELGTGTGAALFAINSSTGAVTNSAALDYEAATSYTYGIQVTDGVYTYTLLAPISVTNVLEVTLSALTLSASTATLNASTTITLTGESAGSTFSIVSGALPTGMSINASTGDITGTPTVEAAYSFTVRETNVDGSNNPRDTALSIMVSSVTAVTAWTPSLATASMFAGWDTTDAAQRSVSSGVVDSLTDISGNGRTLTGTTTTRPGLDNLYLPSDVASFDGVDDILITGNVTLAQPFTVMQTVTPTSNANGFQNAFDGGGGVLFRTNHGGAPLIYAGTILNIPSFTLSEAVVVSHQYVAGTGSFRKNGGGATTGAVGSAGISAAPIRIGNSAINDAQLQGAVGPTYIFPSDLDLGDDLYDRMLGHMMFFNVANSSDKVPSGFAYRYVPPLVGTQPTAASAARQGAVITRGGVGAFNEVNTCDPWVFVDPTDATKLMMFTTCQKSPIGTGEAQIVLWRGTVADPYTWDTGTVVFSKGTGGSWDNHSGGVRLGSVIYDSGTFYMFYCSQRSDVANEIGCATSSDGVTWSRPASPILTPTGQGRNDGVCLGEPSVFLEGGTWTMIYDYRTATETLPGYRAAQSSSPTSGWAKVGCAAGGDDLYFRPRRGMQCEAHQTLKRNGLYYILMEMGGSYAEGTKYRSYVLESDNILGPYVLKKLLIAESGASGTTNDKIHACTPGMFTIGGDDILYYAGTDDLTNPFFNAVWDLCAAVMTDPL